MAPVREKIRELEEEKAGLGHERGAAEAESWAELESLKVTYEGIEKNSKVISRCGGLSVCARVYYGCGL